MVEVTLEYQPSKDDLQHLRKLIAKLPHILQDYDDNVLSSFLRACEGNFRKTTQVLEAFNGLGKRYPGIIKNYDPLDQNLLEHLSETLTFALPKKASDGSTVYMAQLNDDVDLKGNPYKYHSPEFYRYWVLSIYALIWKGDFGSGKWIMVVDCKDCTLKHAREFTVVLLKQTVDIIQYALPIRIQAIHLINFPPFLQNLLNSGKALAKKEISERIYVHRTMDLFYEKFPKRMLPKEYGGLEASALTLHAQWYETIRSFRKTFLDEENKMRRLDPIRPVMEEQEIVQNFRALNID